MEEGKSVGILRRILQTGQPYFLTFPIGYNPFLTAFLEEQLFGPDRVGGDRERLVKNVAIFRRKLFNRWERITPTKADFARFYSLSRQPTLFLAILWKDVDLGVSGSQAAPTAS